MASTTETAQQLIESIQSGQSLEQIKDELQISPDRWFAISSKAYDLRLLAAKQERDEEMNRKNVSATSNHDIYRILALNEKLANYALLLHSLSTMSEFEHINSLTETLPGSEVQILESIERRTMHPKFRAQQKKGRFETLDAFKTFSKIIDASVICYYRQNYISSYLTLAPVIEGVLLRWSGYIGIGKKPEFDEHRKFFKKFGTRQPCPHNILFHQVFVKACDKILNEHLFRPSQNGQAHSNFNRHLAAHLLNDSEFATKENCIRLFLLIDTMTEIYVYESRQPDPRFDLHQEEIEEDITIYANLILDAALLPSPEKKILSN